MGFGFSDPLFAHLTQGFATEFEVSAYDFLENGRWHSSARLPEAKNQIGHAHDKQRNSPKNTIYMQKDQGDENSQKQQGEPNEKEGDFMYFENFMSP